MTSSEDMHDNPRRLALITVLYNSARHLPAFFESIRRQTNKNFYLYVIDNASSDASAQISKNLIAQYHIAGELIVNDKNIGIAAANNQGLKAALSTGFHDLVLLNNDIVFEDNLFSFIYSEAIKRSIQAWTPHALLGDSDITWYGGGFLSYWRARGIHYSEERVQQIKKPESVTYAPTCFMYLHRSAIDTVGLMDEDYFVYYDDTDFCFRMNAAGVRVVYDPRVSIRHYVGGSSGGDLSPFFLRINTRNKFLYIYKNYSGARKALVAFFAVLSKGWQILTSPTRAKQTILGLSDFWRYRSVPKKQGHPK